MNKKIAFKSLEFLMVVIVCIGFITTILFSITSSFPTFTIDEVILMKGICFSFIPLMASAIFAKYRNGFSLVLLVLSLSVPVFGIKHFTDSDSKYSSTETVQIKAGYIFDDVLEQFSSVFNGTLEYSILRKTVREEFDKIRKENFIKDGGNEERYEERFVSDFEWLTDSQYKETSLKVYTQRIEVYKKINSNNPDSKINYVDKTIAEYEKLIKKVSYVKQTVS